MEPITEQATAFPRRGWALLLLGGSASGKSTFIEREHFPFGGRVLSADHLSDVVMRVHNHAAYYARRYPALCREVEQLVRSGLNARNKRLSPHDDDRWPQNIRLMCDTNSLLSRSMSALLSNAVHGKGGRRAYFEGCIERRRSTLGNLIFDMTGDSESIHHYVPILREAGYRILLIWVVANRNYSLIWNRARQRRMKDSAVHVGHNAPNSCLRDYLLQEAGAEIDRAMVVFNTTESLRRAMTDEEWASRRVELPKCDGRFVFPPEVERRLVSVLGKMEVNPLGKEGVPDNRPLFQTDARGRVMVVDEEFLAHRTGEVTTPDGHRFRALYKMDCKGKVVMRKEGCGPQFLCPEKDDPFYPYIPVSEKDFGRKICRRERNGKIKYHKKRIAPTYIDSRGMNRMFWRLAQYNALAAESGRRQVTMPEVVESFEAEQKSHFDRNLTRLYAELGRKEPRLPSLPHEVFDVNPPFRGQFLSEEEYAQAVAVFEEQHRRFEENFRQWEAFVLTKPVEKP